MCLLQIHGRQQDNHQHNKSKTPSPKIVPKVFGLVCCVPLITSMLVVTPLNPLHIAFPVSAHIFHLGCYDFACLKSQVCLPPLAAGSWKATRQSPPQYKSKTPSPKIVPKAFGLVCWVPLITSMLVVTPLNPVHVAFLVSAHFLPCFSTHLPSGML